MDTFDSVIKRIYEILETCKNKTHDFTIVDGGCTDFSQYPEVTFEGDKANCHEIRIVGDNIELYVYRECDSITMSIEELSLTEIVCVLRALEKQFGLEYFPFNKKHTFPITSVTREDITALGFKNAECIDDATMTRIAEKMADAYVEHSFWIDLEYAVERYSGLERE